MQLTIGAHGRPPQVSFFSYKKEGPPKLWLGSWCTRSTPTHEGTEPRPSRAFHFGRDSSSRCLAAPNFVAEARAGPSEYQQAAQQKRQAVLQGDGCQQSGQVLGPSGHPRRVRKASKSHIQGHRVSTLDEGTTRKAKSASREVQQPKSVLGQSAQRLSKVVAQAGLASRRGAEDLISRGHVKVNGHVETVPQYLVTGADEIKVRGKPIPKSTQKYYFVLNKPKGYLCANPSASDSAERTRLVVDLFQPWLQREWKLQHQHPNAVPPRLFTVGRLDVQTTGLIFVTNDGEWAQRVQHPSGGLTKEYVVTLSSVPSMKELEAISAGCVVDGVFVQPVSVSFATLDTRRKDKLRVVVGEGRNREVRMLMESAGLTVASLKRVRVGGFRLPKDLSIGEFRLLKTHEVRRVGDKGFQQNPQPYNQKQPALIA